MPGETELVGRWILEDGTVIGDETEQRIQRMISDLLIRRGEREDGWTVLYENPDDSSYWELTFPSGDSHGGGPAKLSKLSKETVWLLYPDLAVSSG